MTPVRRRRVLLVAPWFRTLAAGWADGLRARGHEVAVVTSPLHFDPPAAGPDDLVLTEPWRSPAGGHELWAALRAVRHFDPDVVITEVGRDPRFLAAALAPRVPVVLTTHDARPHDAAHRPPPLRAAAAAVLRRRAAHEVAFSAFVAAELVAAGRSPGRVSVLPLASELPASLAPREVVPATDRRDVLVVGRLNAYKNLPFVLRAWRAHQRAADFRGDRLVVVGDGDPGCPIPPDVEWLGGRFAFADLVPRLARAKASLVLYSAGSQSGVQVISQQCGTATVASDVGGLAEEQPPELPAVPAGDLTAAVRTLGLLADADRAAGLGRAHRAWHERRRSPEVVAGAWEAVLQQVLRDR